MAFSGLIVCNSTRWIAVAQRARRLNSSSLTLPLSSAAMVLVACTSLTAPPAPEPIGTDSAQVTSAAPKATAAPSTPPAPPPPALPKIVDEKPDPALGIKDVKVGTGAVAKAGDTISVHYRGTLKDGSEFDASRPRGQPFTFRLGTGGVIKGWDQGVAGMKVGGTRKLTIPPALGYGERGAGSKIPPNSTLLFDVELLDVKKPGDH